MKIERVSLLNRLCSVFNRCTPGSPDYVLAAYFLRHYYEMEHLNIYDVAEACYCSRSSIRRFAQSIGFDNYKDFKEQFSKYDDKVSQHVDSLGYDDYKAYLLRSVNSMITGLTHRICEAEDTKRLLNDIYERETVVFYCTGMSETIAIEFQREMILCQKLVHVSTDLETCRTLLASSPGSSLLIVITVTGNFARQSLPAVREMQGKKTLLIVEEGTDLAADFDMVYALASQDSEPNVYLYGRYGIICFFDLLFYLYDLNYPVNC